MFQANGLGDLSMEDGQASMRQSVHTTPIIQHFDSVNIMHLPGLEAMSRLVSRQQSEEQQRALRPHTIDDANGEKVRVIDRPYLLTIWDNARSIPFYMVRIGDPDSCASAKDNASMRQAKASFWKKPLFAKVCHYRFLLCRYTAIRRCLEGSIEANGSCGSG